MNKLLFREGGQPFYLDDLDFMQSAFADTVKGIISMYGNVILSGCNVPPPVSIAGRPTSYSWEEGYIAINGEVYKVENGSFDGASNASLYWKVVSTEGQKEIYENTSENNVYQYKTVILTDTVGINDIYIAKDSVKSVEDILIEKISNTFETPISSKIFSIASNPSASLTVSKNKSTLYCTIFMHNYGTVNLTKGLVGRYPVNELSEEERNTLNQSGIIVIGSSSFGEFQPYILDARYEGEIYLRNMDGSPVTSFSKIGSGTITFINNIM